MMNPNPHALLLILIVLVLIMTASWIKGRRNQADKSDSGDAKEGLSARIL